MFLSVMTKNVDMMRMIAVVVLIVVVRLYQSRHVLIKRADGIVSVVGKINVAPFAPSYLLIPFFHPHFVGLASFSPPPPPPSPYLSPQILFIFRSTLAIPLYAYLTEDQYMYQLPPPSHTARRKYMLAGSAGELVGGWRIASVVAMENVRGGAATSTTPTTPTTPTTTTTTNSSRALSLFSLSFASPSSWLALNVLCRRDQRKTPIREIRRGWGLRLGRSFGNPPPPHDVPRYSCWLAAVRGGARRCTANRFCYQSSADVEGIICFTRIHANWTLQKKLPSQNRRRMSTMHVLHGQFIKKKKNK